MKTIYALGAVLTGVPVFLFSWFHAVESYGWLLGGGLGWIPAMFLAVIAGYFWPIAVGIVALCL